MVDAGGMKNLLRKHCPPLVRFNWEKSILNSLSTKKDQKEKLMISIEGKVGPLTWALSLWWTLSSLVLNGIN